MVERMTMNLFSKSNQNGAPRESAIAVRIQPARASHLKSRSQVKPPFQPMGNRVALSASETDFILCWREHNLFCSSCTWGSPVAPELGQELSVVEESLSLR